MSPLPIYERALQLAKKYPLTKGVTARDNLGVTISALDQDAACFCTIGFLARARRDVGSDVGAAVIFQPIFNRLGINFASRWNDDPERKIEDVRELFRGLVRDFECTRQPVAA